MSNVCPKDEGWPPGLGTASIRRVGSRAGLCAGPRWPLCEEEQVHSMGKAWPDGKSPGRWPAHQQAGGAHCHQYAHRHVAPWWQVAWPGDSWSGWKVEPGGLWTSSTKTENVTWKSNA